MNQSWEDDRDPLRALKARDPAPYEAFVHAELTTFLGFFVRLGAGRAEAEDLVQDLFVKLFEHAGTYEPQGRFAAFAYRVARNLWIDRGRRTATRGTRVVAGPGEEEPLARIADEDAPGPAETLARREEVERLRCALRELPETHRLVFELGVLQELPYQDVGAALEIPVGTVKSRMFHAVRKLRAALGEVAPGEGAGEGAGKQGGAVA